VKSTSDNQPKGSTMSAIKEQPRASRAGFERQSRSGPWVESLRSSDVSRLWAELHRIVCHHPLVRASRNAGLLVEEGRRTPTPI